MNIDKWKAAAKVKLIKLLGDITYIKNNPHIFADKYDQANAYYDCVDEKNFLHLAVDAVLALDKQKKEEELKKVSVADILGIRKERAAQYANN